MTALDSSTRDSFSKRPKSEPKFTSYITSFLKRHNSSFGLTAEASECMDVLIKITIKKIIHNMNMLLSVVDKKTISQRDIHHAIRLTFQHSLLVSSNTYASKAVETYKNKLSSSLVATRSEKAGLVLPVTRIEKIFMDNLEKPKRKTDTLAVYLVGSIENVVLELYTAAGREVSQDKKHRLTPLYITRAIHNNPSLADLYRDCILMNDTSIFLSQKTKKKKKKISKQPQPQILVLESQPKLVKKKPKKPKKTKKTKVRKDRRHAL